MNYQNVPVFFPEFENDFLEEIRALCNDIPKEERDSVRLAETIATYATAEEAVEQIARQGWARYFDVSCLQHVIAYAALEGKTDAKTYLKIDDWRDLEENARAAKIDKTARKLRQKRHAIREKKLKLEAQKQAVVKEAAKEIEELEAEIEMLTEKSEDLLNTSA